MGATGAVEGETGCCCCANAPVHRSAANAARKNVRIKAVSRLLLGGRVVTGLGVDVKGREPFGRFELDLDFSPGAVVLCVAWFVSQNILVS